MICKYRRFRISSLLIVLLLSSGLTYAQKDSLQLDARLSALTSSGDYSPFWLQNNAYGTVSFQPNSIFLRTGILKDFSRKNKNFDYAFKANVLIGSDAIQTRLYLHEYYLKARLWFVDLIAGAREENIGNQDEDLSCGGFLFSHNSRPMPKITAGIENFTKVPFTYGYLEIKGAVSHGWFTDNIYSSGVLLHHKYFSARVGGKLPVHVQYRLDHVVQWGGYIPEWGQQPSSLSDYIKIFLGKQGGSDANLSDRINALGNSIGSENVGLDVDLGDFNIRTYWQDIFEDGPVRQIGYTMNAPDGLWGIVVKNDKFPFVKRILYEYLNTTDQSGPFHDSDGIVYGGNDSYFERQQYGFGWAYYNRIIGTPFITSAVYNQDGSPGSRNSRVQVHHFGMEGAVMQVNYKLLLSFAKNYGTYSQPFSQMKPSTDFLLEANRVFPRLAGVRIGLAVAIDRGTMYGNNTGCMLTLSKQGTVLKW